MKENLKRKLAICSSVSLLLISGSIAARACGSSEVTITNLPALDQTSYQVYGMNSKGQVTGFFVVTGVHGPRAFRYEAGGLSDLGTLGGPGSAGYGINAAGQVTGQADVDVSGASHAFISGAGGLTDLETLGGDSSTGLLINDKGEIAGTSLLPSGSEPVAFRYSNGSLVGLGTLGGNYSYPFGLNNNGQVIGESDLANGDIHAFTSPAGTLTDLGTLGGNYSSAFGINDAGAIVGEAAVANGEVHAFLYSAGAMADLGTIGGTYSSAFLINSNNEIAGNGTASGDQAMHGLFYAKGALTDLGTLGGDRSSVWGMNNCAQIVGDAATAEAATHAFLWENGKMIDLNDKLPANSGWELVSAQFINDAGRIVGYGNHDGGSQWFILDLGHGASAPVAIAGPDQTVDCQAAVQLDGSASHGAAGETLTFEWSLGGSVLGTNALLTVSLPLGTNIVALKVTDPCGGSARTNVTIAVLDQTPPTILSGPVHLKVPAGDNCKGTVPNVLGEVVATDNCTPVDQLIVTQDPPAGKTLPVGHHPITVTVTDASGNVSKQKVALRICDVAPPVINSLAATPAVLSPPNHRMVPVTIAVAASDNCDPAPASKITHVTCSERMDPDDVQITGDLKVKLAATRNPSGPGRVYTITVKCKDAAGNCTTGTVQVTVPKPNDPSPNTGSGTSGHR